MTTTSLRNDQNTTFIAPSDEVNIIRLLHLYIVGNYMLDENIIYRFFTDR